MGRLKKLFQWGKQYTNNRIESSTNQNHDVLSSSSSSSSSFHNSSSHFKTTKANSDTNVTNSSSSTKTMNENFSHSDPKSILKWGLVLSKLPKLVDALTSVNPVHLDQLQRTTLALLDYLSQMASNEIQIQLNQYYSYDPTKIQTNTTETKATTNNTSTPSSK
jgi:hypothetical protein